MGQPFDAGERCWSLVMGARKYTHTRTHAHTSHAGPCSWRHSAHQKPTQLSQVSQGLGLSTLQRLGGKVLSSRSACKPAVNEAGKGVS